MPYEFKGRNKRTQALVAMTGTTQNSYIETLTTTIGTSDYAVAGVAQRWAAPIAVIDAAEGFGEEVWELSQPDSLLAWRMAGSEVISEVTGFRGIATAPGERKVNLQPAGCSTRYRAPRSVKFGQFFITDGLLARVAEGLDVSGFTSASLRPDLIMFHDAELQNRLNIYADRSVDVRHPPSRVEMEARALLVVEHLIGVHHLRRRAGTVRGGLAPKQLKRACEAMEAHLEDDIGLDQLAGIAGCSTTHFSRAFKQSTGLPPFQWLLVRRIERAKTLLANPRLSLVEVALAVGFAAQPQFTTAFRRIAGVTPGKWRRELLA